jgi:hypothetical protein
MMDASTPGREATPGTREILSRLLEATPLPTPGCDVEQLLAVFETVLTERAAVLARIVPPLRVTDDDRPLLDELEQRQAAWQAALGAARLSIGDARVGTHQLRAYAPTP